MVYEENSKKIKIDNLGGPDSINSRLFSKELAELKEAFSANQQVKNSFLKDQISKASVMDGKLKVEKEMQKMNPLYSPITITTLFEKNILKK